MSIAISPAITSTPESEFSLTSTTSSLLEKQLIADWLLDRLVGIGEGKVNVTHVDGQSDSFVHVITHRPLSETELQQYAFLMGIMSGGTGMISQTYIDPQIPLRDYSTILESFPDPSQVSSITRNAGKLLVEASQPIMFEAHGRAAERQLDKRVVFKEKMSPLVSFEGQGVVIVLPQQTESLKSVTDDNTGIVLNLLRGLSDNYEGSLNPESRQAKEIARKVRRIFSETGKPEYLTMVSRFDQIDCVIKAPFDYIFHPDFYASLVALKSALSPDQLALIRISLEPEYEALYDIVAEELGVDFQWSISASPKSRTLKIAVASTDLHNNLDHSSMFLLKNLERRIEWRTGHTVSVEFKGEAPHLAQPRMHDGQLSYGKASAFATEFESAARRILGKCVVALEGNRIILSGLPSNIERNRDAILDLSEHAPVFVEVRRAQPKSIRYSEDEAITELHAIAREFPLVDPGITILKDGTLELKFYNPAQDSQSSWYQRLESRIQELTTFLDTKQQLRFIQALGEESVTLAVAKHARADRWEIDFDPMNVRATVAINCDNSLKGQLAKDVNRLTGWKIDFKPGPPPFAEEPGKYQFDAPHSVRQSSAQRIERFLHTTVTEVCAKLEATWKNHGSVVTITYPWFDLPRLTLKELEHRFSTAPVSVRLVPQPRHEATVADLASIARLSVTDATEILHFGDNENGCFSVGVSGAVDAGDIRLEISRCLKEPVEVYHVYEREAVTSWLEGKSPGIRSVLWPLVKTDGTIVASQANLATLRDHMHGDQPEEIKYCRNPSPPRSDHTDKYCITLDPPHTVIRDDAYSIEDLGNDQLRIGIHIADATEICAPGSLLDWQAFRRSTNVYSGPDMKRMFPREIAQLASLDPGKDRSAWSTYLTVDSSGRLLESSFERTIVKSRVALPSSDLSQLAFDSNGVGTFARNIINAAGYVKLGTMLPEALKEVANPLAVLKLAAERALAEHAYVQKIPMFTFSPPMLSVADKHRFVSTVRSLVSMKNVGSLYTSAEFATWPELRRQSLRLADRLRKDGNTGAADAIVEMIDGYARDESILNPTSGQPLGESVFTRISAGLRNYSFLVNQRQLASLFGAEERLSVDELLTINGFQDSPFADKTTEEEVALIAHIRNVLPNAHFQISGTVHSVSENCMIISTSGNDERIYVPVKWGDIPDPVGSNVIIRINGYNVLHDMRVGTIVTVDPITLV